MSDLCYNCSTCHLTAGPCLRDLVQCEICYAWGHLYIFCPRGVGFRDRAYRYWGKPLIMYQNENEDILLTHILQHFATTATLGTYRTHARNRTIHVVNVVILDTSSSFVQSNQPTGSAICESNADSTTTASGPRTMTFNLLTKVPFRKVSFISQATSPQYLRSS
jgi:hypothetical protein